MSEYDELVRGLNELQALPCVEDYYDASDRKLFGRAAAAIEALQSEVERLKEVLKGCVDAYDFVAKDPYDTGLEPIHDAASVARSALEAKP